MSKEAASESQKFLKQNKSYVDITGLDKADVLFCLWQYARPVPWLEGTDFIPSLTKKQAAEDLNHMVKTDDLFIRYYYGKIFFIDFSSDKLNAALYNYFINEKYKAPKLLKKLRTTITNKKRYWIRKSTL